MKSCRLKYIQNLGKKSDVICKVYPNIFLKKMREYGVQNDTNNRNSHGEEHVLNLWA